MRRELYLEDLRNVLVGFSGLDALCGQRVLVTGAGGLLGSTLVDLLLLIRREWGIDVRPVALARDEASLRARFASEDGVEYRAQSVLDPVETEPLVVHAASPADPRSFSLDPVGTMQANLLGTINLLESLRKRGAGRLLFVSSGEVYGEGAGDYREGDCGYLDSMNPRSCYGESKRAAETLCASYFRQYGVDSVVARPCHCYGAAITAQNQRADAQFLRNALRGEDIVMKSAGSQVRSYLYAPDAAAALLRVLLSGEKGEAYNLANPNSVLSIRQFAEHIADAAGVQLRLELPSDAEKAGYSVITKATLNAEKLGGLGYRALFDPGEGVGRMVEMMR